MPVGVPHDDRVVELLDDVVSRRANVEIETPVNVVGMKVAGAEVFGAVIDDCSCRRGTEQEAGRDDNAVRSERRFRILPIALGRTAVDCLTIVTIFNFENRDMGMEQHPFAAVVDIFQFDA